MKKINPRNKKTRYVRVARGGAEYEDFRLSRSANRLAYHPASIYSNVGFRYVLIHKNEKDKRSKGTKKGE